MASARDWHALDWFGALNRGHFFASTLFLSDTPADSLGIRGREIPDRLVVSIQGKSKCQGRPPIRSSARFGWIAGLIRIVNLWRLLRSVSNLAKSRNPTLFHAYSMSYALVCAVAGVRYVAMPQGSDLLVRPEKSLMSRVLTRFAISRAWTVAVTSPSLRERAESFGAERFIEVQNGVSLYDASLARQNSRGRHRITSIRAIKENYRIIEILKERNNFVDGLCITFTYPEMDTSYFASVEGFFIPCDENLGSLADKQDLFRVYSESLVCVSIPTSDASPRSVYEAIFCGAIILAADSSWINNLPYSMRQRVIIVETNKEGWLKTGLAEARKILAGDDFEPCPSATARFSEDGAVARFVSESSLMLTD